MLGPVQFEGAVVQTFRVLDRKFAHRQQNSGGQSQSEVSPHHAGQIGGEYATPRMHRYAGIPLPNQFLGKKILNTLYTGSEVLSPVVIDGHS